MKQHETKKKGETKKTNPTSNSLAKNAKSQYALEMYESLFDYTDDAIYILDKDARFIMVNRGAEEMYGYTLQEFIGKTPANVSAPGKNDLNFVALKLKDAFNGKPQQIDFWGLRKNGEVFPKIVKLYPGHFKGEKVVTAFAIDITDRKRDEEELRKRYVYEKIISTINALAINPGEVDTFIDRCLQVIGKSLQLSRVYLFKYDNIDESLCNTHEWVNNNITSEKDNLQDIPCLEFNSWMDNLKANRVINITSVDEVKEDNLRELLRSQKIQSLLVVPMFSAKQLKGFIGFDECDYKRVWEDSDINLLRSVAQNIGRSIDHHSSIHKLTESQRSLESLYNLLRSVSDNLTDMLWAKDMNKNYIFANKAICTDLLKATNTDEPLGKNDLYFATRERKAHPTDPQWHTFGEVCQDSDQVVIDTGKPGQFDEYGNVSGKFLYLDVHKSPLFNEQGEMIGVVGSARNVTHEKTMQEKLQQSEEKYRYIIQNISEGIVNLNLHGKILHVNKALVDIAQVPVEKIINRNVIKLVKELVQFSEVPQILQKVKIGLSGKTLEPFELTYKQKVLEISVSFNKNTKTITGIIRDITKRKREEEELKMYREKLEYLVAERTTELSEKNKELERFNDLFVGREFRIKELKTQIADLKKLIKSQDDN